MEFCHKVSVIAADHDPDSFFAIAEGLENEPERGKRCLACYEQRLKATAELASKGGYDWFATTLTLSPLKPSRIINEIGITLSPQLYLPSDFKKNNGYLRSIELSRKYDLYRQDYCGCIYSRRRD